MKFGGERMRKINTPEVPFNVGRQRLEDHPARRPPRHSGLDDLGGAQVAHRAPCCACQARIGVAVLPIGVPTEREPFRGELGADFRPHSLESLQLRARPWQTYQPMKGRSPILLDVVRYRPVQLTDQHLRGVQKGLDGIGHQCPGDPSTSLWGPLHSARYADELAD